MSVFEGGPALVQQPVLGPGEIGPGHLVWSVLHCVWCSGVTGRLESNQLHVRVHIAYKLYLNDKYFPHFDLSIISLMVVSILSSVISIPYLMINILGVSKHLTPHLSGKNHTRSFK